MWLWIISNIAGALLGAATVGWLENTRFGKWAFDKYLSIVYWANEKYGIDILNKEEVSWETKYPTVARKMRELEKRIRTLEEKNES